MISARRAEQRAVMASPSAAGRSDGGGVLDPLTFRSNTADALGACSPGLTCREEHGSARGVGAAARPSGARPARRYDLDGQRALLINSSRTDALAACCEHLTCARRPVSRPPRPSAGCGCGKPNSPNPRKKADAAPPMRSAHQDVPTPSTRTGYRVGAPGAGMAPAWRDQVAPADGGCAHPPVTLMWRATAGRLVRRSMTKSCPLGLRAIAASMAARSGSSLELARNGARRSAASSWPRHM
jgi:hypothetical protein